MTRELVLWLPFRLRILLAVAKVIPLVGASMIVEFTNLAYRTPSKLVLQLLYLSKFIPVLGQRESAYVLLNVIEG